jgi:hypothetical protein
MTDSFGRTDGPPCPVCGARMRQTRRGATLARRGPAYVCPVDESEICRDTLGHPGRCAGARHAWLRVWYPEELECVTCSEERDAP